MALVAFDVEAEAACIDESLLNRICAEISGSSHGANFNKNDNLGGAARDSGAQKQRDRDYGGRNGGHARDDKGNGKGDKKWIDFSKVKCFNCNQMGHFASHCYTNTGGHKGGHKRPYENDGGKATTRPMDAGDKPFKFVRR
jgi:hypothetical protein